MGLHVFLHHILGEKENVSAPAVPQDWIKKTNCSREILPKGIVIKPSEESF